MNVLVPLKNIFFQFFSALAYLQIGEAMTSVGQTDEWMKFKQILRFASSSLDFITNNVKNIGKEIKDMYFLCFYCTR